LNEAAAPSITHVRGTALFTCVLAALAGLMFGLDIGVISGATQFIQKTFAISDDVIERRVTCRGTSDASAR